MKVGEGELGGGGGVSRELETVSMTTRYKKVRDTRLRREMNTRSVTSLQRESQVTPSSRETPHLSFLFRLCFCSALVHVKDIQLQRDDTR